MRVTQPLLPAPWPASGRCESDVCPSRVHGNLLQLAEHFLASGSVGGAQNPVLHRPAPQDRADHANHMGAHGRVAGNEISWMSKGGEGD